MKESGRENNNKIHPSILFPLVHERCLSLCPGLGLERQQRRHRTKVEQLGIVQAHPRKMAHSGKSAILSGGLQGDSAAFWKEELLFGRWVGCSRDHALGILDRVGCGERWGKGGMLVLEIGGGG